MDFASGPKILLFKSSYKKHRFILHSVRTGHDKYCTPQSRNSVQGDCFREGGVAASAVSVFAEAVGSLSVKHPFHVRSSQEVVEYLREQPWKLRCPECGCRGIILFNATGCPHEQRKGLYYATKRRGKLHRHMRSVKRGFSGNSVFLPGLHCYWVERVMLCSKEWGVLWFVSWPCL